MPLRRIVDRIVALLAFVGLFVYTLAFPGTTSWFILLFFSLAAVVLWLTTLIAWRRIEAEPNRIRLISWLPVLLPELRIGVEGMEARMPALFRRRFDLAMRLARGRYTFLAVETSGVDFFGFFRHHRVKRVPVALDIYPETVPVFKLAYHPEMRRYLQASAPEIRQIRDYMPADPLKHVDWKASFRRDKWMVKEYEKEIEPRLHLVFIGYETPRFEQLLSLVYSAEQEWQDKLAVRVDLVGGDSFLTIQPSPDKGALLAEWQRVEMKHGKTLVFAPEALAEELRLGRRESFLLVTEAGEVR